MSTRSMVLPVLLGLALAPAPALPAGVPGASPVSPGESDRAVEIASACPAFHWAGVAGAEAYELAVFAVAAEEEPRLVLRQVVLGAALGWTPSREACLAAGGEYAWTVRALGKGGEPLAGDAGWSSPRRFAVPALPADADVAAALEVLRRWQAGAPGALGPVATQGSAAGGATAARGGPAAVNAPNVSGTSAIRGENAAGAGSQHGVLGQTASPAGAGLAAINLAAGPDLVLDGAAHGDVDTLFTESGIDRPAAGDQTFDIGNSGAGRLTLLVDGVPVSGQGAPLEVFQTAATYDGSGPAGYGRAGMHAGCRTEDPSSHFCTIQEIETAWKEGGLSLEATGQAWVDNAIVGTIDSGYLGDTGAASDWYGGSAVGDFPYNCNAWTISGNGGRGLILNSGAITPAIETCDDIHPIACCK